MDLELRAPQRGCPDLHRRTVQFQIAPNHSKTQTKAVLARREKRFKDFVF